MTFDHRRPHMYSADKAIVLSKGATLSATSDFWIKFLHQHSIQKVFSLDTAGFFAGFSLCMLLFALKSDLPVTNVITS